MTAQKTLEIPDKLIKELLPRLDFTDLKMALIFATTQQGLTQRRLRNLTGQSAGSICERLQAWQQWGFVKEVAFINIDTSTPKHLCSACKTEYPFLHNHHLIPQSQGRDNNPDNLVKLCPNCHRLTHSALWRLTHAGRVWLGLEEEDNATKTD